MFWTFLGGRQASIVGCQDYAPKALALAIHGGGVGFWVAEMIRVRF